MYRNEVFAVPNVTVKPVVEMVDIATVDAALPGTTTHTGICDQVFAKFMLHVVPDVMLIVPVRSSAPFDALKPVHELAVGGGPLVR